MTAAHLWKGGKVRGERKGQTGPLWPPGGGGSNLQRVVTHGVGVTGSEVNGELNVKTA